MSRQLVLRACYAGYGLLEAAWRVPNLVDGDIDGRYARSSCIRNESGRQRVIVGLTGIETSGCTQRINDRCVRILFVAKAGWGGSCGRRTGSTDKSGEADQDRLASCQHGIVSPSSSDPSGVMIRRSAVNQEQGEPIVVHPGHVGWTAAWIRSSRSLSVNAGLKWRIGSNTSPLSKYTWRQARCR